MQIHPVVTPSAAPQIVRQLLPYNHKLPLRPLDAVDLVVVHCTELPGLELAREFGEQVRYPDSGTGNAGHFYVDVDGRLYQWVEAERAAHHVRGMNERSIGIELVNAGRYPDWYHSARQDMTDPYPAVQIDAFRRLLERLERIMPGLAWIAGHEDLDTEMIPAEDDPGIMIRRKVDPGPMFPWQDVMSGSQLTKWRDPEA